MKEIATGFPLYMYVICSNRARLVQLSLHPIVSVKFAIEGCGYEGHGCAPSSRAPANRFFCKSLNSDSGHSLNCRQLEYIDSVLERQSRQWD